jgi:hypothetical protein
MPLSYLRDDCHKQAVTHIRESRRFESMYTLQGKTRPTRHVRFHTSPRTLGIRFLRAAPYVATFHESLTELSRPIAPEKKGSRHNPQRTADRSAGLYPASILSQPMKQWG